MPERTQRITAIDRVNGRIRVPRDAKPIFPPGRVYVRMITRGQTMAKRWDPRFGPDRERSGVLSIGRRQLPGLVRPDDVLRITLTDDGRIRLA